MPGHSEVQDDKPCTYAILENYDDTVCVEETAKAIMRRYLKNGYRIIGRVKCDKRNILLGKGAS